jgi:hypothetical protein
MQNSDSSINVHSSSINSTDITDSCSLFPNLEEQDVKDLKCCILRTLWQVNSLINDLEDYLLQDQHCNTSSELWSALETLHKASILLESAKNGTGNRE